MMIAEKKNRSSIPPAPASKSHKAQKPWRQGERDRMSMQCNALLLRVPNIVTWTMHAREEEKKNERKGNRTKSGLRELNKRRLNKKRKKKSRRFRLDCVCAFCAGAGSLISFFLWHTHKKSSSNWVGGWGGWVMAGRVFSSGCPP